MRVVSLCLFVAALSLSHGDSPIARVVVLIEGLKSKIIADGQMEQAVYDKYACWCEKTTGRKASAIEAAKASIDSLSNDIKKLKGRLGSFVAEVAGLEKNIAETQASITKTEKLRKNENEEFLSDKASLEQGIANLEKAVQVLSAGTSGVTTGVSSSAMMETRMLTVAAGVRNAMRLYEKHNSKSLPGSQIGAEEFATVKSFLGTPSAWVETSASVYSPHKGTYSTQSGAVQGILADMLDTFKRNRESAIEEETMKAAEYQNLMDTKRKDLSLLKKTLTKKKMDQGDDTKALGEAKLNRADTQEQLDTDEAFFKTTQKACKAKADEWSERSRLRAEELAGINEAVAILTSDDATATFTEAGTFFLQTSASRDRSEAAYRALQETARASGSPKLAALATKAKMTAKGHFDRIIKNIEKMMANLRQEEKDDITKKTWCENEMASSNNRNEALEADKDQLTSKINRGTNKISELNGAIADAEGAINEEEETMANATDSRNADNRAFKAAIKADTDSVMLVTKAIEALSKFYSLRQDHVKHTKDTIADRKQPEYTTSEDTPPETFEGTYGGRGSENTGIVGILDMIKEDLQKDIAKAHEEEAEGMAAYRELIEESKETIAALNKKINAMKTQIADTEYQKEEDSTEWKEKDQQKKATDAYIAEIKPNCDWIKDNFKPRAEARKTEMDGLDTAKGQLAGMQEMAAIATSNAVATAGKAAPAWKPPSVDDELAELDSTAKSYGLSFLQRKA
jgi:DNA repair exonuclease SbcCD ATPase subunit